MLIPDEFITDDIHATEEYKEYIKVFVGVDIPMIQPQPVVSTQGTHRTTPSAHRSPTLNVDIASKKKRKQVAGETSSPRKSFKVTIQKKKAKTTPIPPPSDDQERDDIAKATLLSLTLHKNALAAEARENIAKVKEKLEEEEIEKMVEGEDDEESYSNDKKDVEKANDDEEKDETGSMETRKEKMQTPIPSPTRSPRKNLSLDKTLTQELMKTILPYTTTTSKAQRKTRRYMIQCMEKKYVNDREFWKVHRKVDKVLHEITPRIVENATNDVIKGNLKKFMPDTIIQERDALQAEVSALVLKEFADQAPHIIDELFKSYVVNNVIQVHPTTSTSTSTTPSTNLQQQLDDVFRPQHHDDHQEDDAPPEGEKGQKDKRLRIA
ncbi:hypothetical protein Tco_0662843 [Tanacetum coccineum]